MAPLDPVSIDALLPQTQCTQCGFAGCMPYAEAIAAGAAPINRCPPGGDDGIRALAALTGLAYAPLDPAHGVHKPRTVAVIDESACIGCTICIQKCPVDAIIGAAKRMHTVIADQCTGCELCVVPCPVDCIAMVAPSPGHPALSMPAAAANDARSRYRARVARIALSGARGSGGKVRPRAAPARASAEAQIDGLPAGADRLEAMAAIGSPEHKRQAIAAAIARAKALQDAADRA